MFKFSDAIRAFRLHHLEYSTPEGARDQCKQTASAFTEMLLSDHRAAGRGLVDEIDVVDACATTPCSGVARSSTGRRGTWTRPHRKFPRMSGDLERWLS